MRILIIAPLPPPITGNSLSVKVFYEQIAGNNLVDVININKSSFKSGVSSIGRVSDVLKILFQISKKVKTAEKVYFSISESFAGNLKDLLIYLICFRRLNMMAIHLLGGSGIRVILGKRGWQYRLNSFFIKRLGSVIVEGNTQVSIFSDLIPSDRIHVVNNFAEDFLFVRSEEIENKFRKTDPLKILFLSNLIYGKGYLELLEAYLGLNIEIKNKVKIGFVGGFETEKNKTDFMARIEGHSGIVYYGTFIGGLEKKALYMDSHVFCLPTYYPYEGQPLSILEAYATGCAVITTNHGGISDIFADGKNGFEVVKKSVDSLRKVIEIIAENPEKLLQIGKENNRIAFEKYRTSIYTGSLIKIMDNLGAL